MKIVFFLFCFWLLALPVKAQVRSPRAVHPVAHMYQVPVGDTPGWFGKYWFEVEASQANIWNTPMTLLNLENNHYLTYFADFEQTTYNLRQGFQVNDDFAFTVELPYAIRNGGFLDSTIEKVHQVLGTQRFMREDYAQGGSTFQVSDNGVYSLNEGPSAGLSSVVLGLKYWPLKWMNKTTPGGLGFGIQAALPVDSSPRGYNSGGVNTTALAHVGAPIGEESGFWLTGALSYVPENKYFENWPRKKYLQMYEASLEIGLGAGIGIFLQARVESPLMDRDKLEFVDQYPTRYDYLMNRMSSGYNSLVHWRGYEAIGLRFQLGEQTFLRLSILEDGAIGGYDETGDKIYVTNSPDVMGVMQFSMSF